MQGGATDAMVVLLMISIAMVIIGLVIGANPAIPFQSLDTFVMWPMFLLSGALFLGRDLSPWIDAVTKINPMIYGVDAMRN
jgi:ABC-2 type transport system permease protein